MRLPRVPERAQPWVRRIREALWVMVIVYFMAVIAFDPERLWTPWRVLGVLIVFMAGMEFEEWSADRYEKKKERRKSDGNDGG